MLSPVDRLVKEFGSDKYNEGDVWGYATTTVTDALKQGLIIICPCEGRLYKNARLTTSGQREAKRLSNGSVHR
jgi:hypothetical protein